MDLPIFQLVYTSKSSLLITSEFLNGILENAREHNSREGITGFLTARDGYFLQLLEGEETNVRECFNRILKDNRHSQITLQGEARVATRSTPNWSMGWSADGQSAVGLIELFELGRSGKTFKDSSSLLKILKMFSRNAKILG
jgi:hypothetical protein